MRFVLEQSFATGGWGPNESFRKPGSSELADSLTKTHSSFETPCGVYGHFKISRYLMQATGESTHGDSMEAILHNTILGARPTRPDGITFYYSDYNHNAVKTDYEQKWPCCSGTFAQLTADYGISSYMRSANGIFVNLYVPSTVSWQQGSAKAVLTQQTQYPTANESALHLQLTSNERFTIALRIPAWAGPATRVTINGRSADLHPLPAHGSASTALGATTIASSSPSICPCDWFLSITTTPILQPSCAAPSLFSPSCPRLTPSPKSPCSPHSARVRPQTNGSSPPQENRSA